MTIEPSDNPHLVIGKLMHENITLKQRQQRLDDDLQFVRGQLLGCRGVNQTLKEQVETHEKTIGILNGQLDGCHEANQILINKNKELEKLLKEEREAYIRLKSLRHAANYGIGAQQFAEIMLKKSSNEQTATEVLEVQNLKREVNRLSMKELELKDAYLNIKVLQHTSLRAQEEYKRAILQRNEAQKDLEKLTKMLIEERDVRNKLKALCHERNFGTPLHPPINQPRTLPPWSVDFPTKDHDTITILFYNSPSVARLNDIQERLEATGWILTYNGFKQ